MNQRDLKPGFANYLRVLRAASGIQLTFGSTKMFHSGGLPQHYHDWRQHNSSVGLLKQLCMSGVMADIYFVFPNREEQEDSLPAHKFILGMRSPIFETMFFGLESGKHEGEVVVRDIRATTFRTVLRYIYTDAVEFDGNTVLHVLYAAKKYHLYGLVSECESFLQTAIDVNNVCSMYNQALFYDMDLLQEQCASFICMNANDVFDTDDFLQLTPIALKNIISNGSLGVGEELDVFNAAVKWAENHCKKKGFEPTPKNIRAWLGDALYQVRLPLIPVTEFTSTVVESGLLNQEEQVDLYKYLTIHKHNDIEESTVDFIGKYVAKIRPGSIFEFKLPVSGPDNVKKCLTAAAQILMVADKPLRLRRITLFYSEAQYAQNISVTVTNMKSKEYVKPEIEPVGEKGPLVFPKGVYLSPNTQYNIAVNCMIYRGDVKALEMTETIRGTLINISSVFNSFESIHLSRVHQVH